MPSERLRALNRQIERLARQIDKLDRRSQRYSWLRLILFSSGMIASAVLFYTASVWIAGLVLAVTILLFVTVVLIHRRVDDSRQRFEHLRQHLLAQVARATRDWAQIPLSRQTDPRFDHAFEADLDLVGERSLHRLLDTAVAAQGSARLRAWLTEMAPEGAQTLHRQQLVRELVPLVLLRNHLVIAGRQATPAETAWEPARLLGWLQAQRLHPHRRLWLIGLGALAAVNILLFLGDWLGLLAPLWRYTLAVYVLLYGLHARNIGEVFHVAADLREDVERLLAVFRRLERYRYRRTPHLAELCMPFVDQTQRPSHYLRRLALVAAATGVQGNPLIALVLNTLMPWGLFFAYVLDQLQAALARRAPVWLDPWYELEALSALANFAYLNPDCTFPNIRTGEVEPVFVAHDIAHPLLATAGKVRNDFTFAQLGSVVILTGSNMAGKSTFLKALGVNLALAYAGGVVDARQLDTILFRLFTCIKVSDSVTNGVSYFYAEVQRLKALLTALETPHPLPLFFAIDEIFRGTNNRERLLGSRAYIHALINQRGVGLIATHDLELVKLADRLPAIRNYHFRDDIINGKMVFDYLLRPGPSPTTNALKIMHSAGLPVDSAEANLC